MSDSTMIIDTSELRSLLDQHARVTVFDVRPSAERAEWSIPGSIHSDVYDALIAGNPAALAGIELPADRPVVTVCGAGVTSLTAARQLRERGLAARSLAGGMKAWSLAWNAAEMPLPVSPASIVQVRRTGKGCLSYLIGSQGEAAVIDPALDPALYIDLARHYGWTITHVLETHVHADHLMRSRLLAARTGATLHLPETDRFAFAYAPLRDGDILDVGDATIRVLHTPGHTLESTSYLLDREALFTGDTLFLAGVGRPDLEASPDETRQRAHLLYGSLQTLLKLPPQTLVLPGHSSEPAPFDAEPLRSTIGEIQARVALLQVGEDEFVNTLLARIPATPPNHHRIVELNEAGDFPPGDPTDLEAGANRCAIS